MNRQIFRLLGITEEEYQLWCKEHDLPPYKQSTKQSFFEDIQNGRIVKDSKTGKLIKRK